MLPPGLAPGELDAFEHTAIEHIISSQSLEDSPRHPSSSWFLKSLEASTFHTEYHNLSQIMQFGDELAVTFPHQVELVKLGQTSEDRDIMAIRIGKKPTGKKSKPRIVLQGAQHARDVGTCGTSSKYLLITLMLVVDCDIVRVVYRSRARRSLQAKILHEFSVGQLRTAFLRIPTVRLLTDRGLLGLHRDSNTEPRWLCLHLGGRPFMV